MYLSGWFKYICCSNGYGYTCYLILSCSYQWCAYESYCLLIWKVLMHYCLSKASCMCTINTGCFPGTNDQSPLLYYAWQHVLWCVVVVVLIYSGPWIWCALHSFLLFAEVEKEASENTVTVKALSMGSKLRWRCCLDHLRFQAFFINAAGLELYHLFNMFDALLI